MDRLLGPNLDGRLAYVPAPGVLAPAAGFPAVVYANVSGDTLADIQIYNGTDTPAGPVPNSTLTVDGNSFIPLFWFPPNNVDTVYIEVNGGTRTAVHSDYDNRIDNTSGYVNGPLMSTGLIAGGGLSTNISNPQAIDIAPFIGYVVDYATDSFSPTLRRVSSNVTQTVLLDAGSLLRIVTWWSVDGDGAVYQTAERPSNELRRSRIQLGVTLYDPFIGNVFAQNNVPNALPQISNQVYDLLYALGGFSITGNTIGTNGVTLSISKTAGFTFSPGVNFTSMPNNPHVQFTAATAPMIFRHATRIADSFTTTRTVIDVANYDANGVLTAIGGGSNSSTIFRVWFVPLQDASFQYIIQYGQTVYSSLAAATNAIGRTNYVTNPSFAGTAVLLGHIAVIRTATSLSDPTQAAVVPAISKFARA